MGVETDRGKYLVSADDKIGTAGPEGEEERELLDYTEDYSDPRLAIQYYNRPQPSMEPIEKAFEEHTEHKHIFGFGPILYETNTEEELKFEPEQYETNVEEEQKVEHELYNNSNIEEEEKVGPNEVTKID